MTYGNRKDWRTVGDNVYGKPTETIGYLTDEFAAWCKANALPHMSADELLYEVAETATHLQKEYIALFIERWDAAQKRDDMKQGLR